MTHWNCRMTLVGSKRSVPSIGNTTAWEKIMAARYIDWLQLSPEWVCQFETSTAPVAQLKKLSRRWKRITLLLDYEHETHRIKGLAKAKAGKVEHCEIGY